MADDSIVGLVRDLTAKLSDVAVEFGERADRLDAPSLPTAADHARRLLAERAARLAHFPADLFHEPAWDMLLALLVADDEGVRMSVKALVASAHAPSTTSQRWIDHLAKLGLVDRAVDPLDRRRMEVSLSEAGMRGVRAYLAEIAGR